MEAPATVRYRRDPVLQWGPGMEAREMIRPSWTSTQPSRFNEARAWRPGKYPRTRTPEPKSPGFNEARAGGPGTAQTLPHCSGGPPDASMRPGKWFPQIPTDTSDGYGHIREGCLGLDVGLLANAGIKYRNFKKHKKAIRYWLQTLPGNLTAQC